MSAAPDILRAVWAGAVGASPLEQAGSVLGVLGVWLMIRQNLWTFPVSLVQVALFGYVCFTGKLYSETVLQGIFFVALAYGWWHWTHAGDKRPELPVTRLPPRALAGWIAGTLLVWLAWGTAMHRLTDAALPYGDAFVFAVSVSSQWLQARKRIENWPGWLIANTVAVGVFWYKEYYWFAVLYGLFWWMALGGWCAWRKTLRNHA